jgi:hypothetical protein
MGSPSLLGHLQEGSMFDLLLGIAFVGMVIGPALLTALQKLGSRSEDRDT